MTREPRSLRLPITCLLAFALAALPACSDDPAAVDDDSATVLPLPAPQSEALDAYLSEALERYGVPGAAVALVRGGEVVYQRTLGVRGVGDPGPIEASTRFLIGSLAKGMTSLMMASLADDGIVRWDEPVVDILPSFALSDPASTPGIRVRDLLNHSSGVPQYDTPLMVEAMSPTTMVASVQNIPTVAPPGQVYGYSNQMYATGGYVAALLAGARYEDDALEAGYAKLMQERVFDAVEMPRTTLDIDAAIADPDHARPNAIDPELDAAVAVPIDFERFTTSVAPAGAVWSSVEDMAAYAITQLHGVSPGGRRVASLENLTLTHAANIEIASGASYALGWVALDDFEGVPAVWHNGGTTGFTTSLLLLPEQDVGVVVLANRSSADAFYGAVNRFAVETLLAREHAGDADIFASESQLRDSLQRLASQTRPVTASDVTGLVGSYQHHVEVAFENDTFTLGTDFGPAPLRAVGDAGTFVTSGFAAGALLGQFSSDPAGAPTLTLGTPGDGELGEALSLARE
jgi:CubicO group peptidase (beta-lactamase class C family)